MIDIKKYIPIDKAQILHTSGHAQLLQGERIGAASNRTFEQRLQVQQRERTVGEYRHSVVGSLRGSVRPTIAPPAAKRYSSPASQRSITASQQKGGFREPPSRGYNPYS